MTDNRTRLAIAGRIAAGICANQERYQGQSHESEVAGAAWAIAGKLIRLAAAEEDHAPGAMDEVAGYVRKYNAKSGAPS